MYNRAIKLVSAVISAGIAVGSISAHECGSVKEVALQSPNLFAGGSSFNIFEDDYEEENIEAIETAFMPVSYGNARLDINDYTFVAMTSYSDVASEFGNNPADPITYDGGTYWLNSDVIVIAANDNKDNYVEQKLETKPDGGEDEEEASDEESQEDSEIKNLLIGDTVVRISYTNVWSLVKLSNGTHGYVRNSTLSDTEITPVPTATPTPTDTPTPTPKPASRNTNTPTPKPKATATPVPKSDDSDSGSSGSSDYNETEVSKTVYASCALNTRSGPGISYSLLSTLSVGTAISVVAETDNGWYRSSSGFYVKASLCLDNEPSPTPTPEPSSSGGSSMGDTSTDFATFVKSFIGCKYVSGGASPSGFDCSGFVMYCYKTYYGINLPHGATSQSYEGYEVDPDDIQVGDIICFDRNGDGTMEHSALYVGNDTYVHAQSSKTGVVASTYSSAKNIAHIRRVR